ncbi:ATP-dependent DNA helicase [Trichonephila clavipes]|nr:ATP-dependent DNA helicase [Trichonephila clavipes]
MTPGLLEGDALFGNSTLDEASISESPNKKTYQLYFLDSPGGTGKTFLITLVTKPRSAAVEKRKYSYWRCSSGIAATLIHGGKTAHSAFKLPHNLHHSESVNCNISKQSDMVYVLREAKLIIWDQCTMAHKKGIEALNRTLQDIRGCNQIMGGLLFYCPVTLDRFYLLYYEENEQISSRPVLRHLFYDLISTWYL